MYNWEFRKIVYNNRIITVLNLSKSSRSVSVCDLADFVKSVVRVQGEEHYCREVNVIERIDCDATTVLGSSAIRFNENRVRGGGRGENEQNDKVQV